jgi:hypothetical protein
MTGSSNIWRSMKRSVMSASTLPSESAPVADRKSKLRIIVALASLLVLLLQIAKVIAAWDFAPVTVRVFMGMVLILGLWWSRTVSHRKRPDWFLPNPKEDTLHVALLVQMAALFSLQIFRGELQLIDAAIGFPGVSVLVALIGIVASGVVVYLGYRVLFG